MSGSDKSGEHPDTEERSHLTEREARQASELKKATDEFKAGVKRRSLRKSAERPEG